MPIFKILTNLPKNKVPSDFTKKIVPVLSKTVQKPEENFICLVTTDVHMTMFGDSNPGVVSSLESVGNLGPERNIVITANLSDFIEKELGIPKKRILITYYDLEDYNVAVNGTTVREIRK